MPILNHVISFRPRLIANVSVPSTQVTSPNAAISREYDLEGAREDMFFVTRTQPSIQNQIGYAPIGAYCVEDDKIKILYWGTGGFAHEVTVIGI